MARPPDPRRETVGGASDGASGRAPVLVALRSAGRPEEAPTMKKLLDSWAGIGLIAVVLAALGAVWAQTTV